jgi:hypothetical protein
MIAFLGQILRTLVGLFRTPSQPDDSATREHVRTNYSSRTRCNVRRYRGTNEPPPMQWKACHHTTIARFKAEMTCPHGHALTLKSHSVSASGIVSPSVVCPSPGCRFHEFVALDDWDFGEVA